jgi:hypothetical protein
MAFRHRNELDTIVYTLYNKSAGHAAELASESQSEIPLIKFTMAQGNNGKRF